MTKIRLFSGTIYMVEETLAEIDRLVYPKGPDHPSEKFIDLRGRQVNATIQTRDVRFAVDRIESMEQA